jgi:ribonuclease HI
MLYSLLPKWNPMLPQPEDWEAGFNVAAPQDPNTKVFNPKVTTHGTLADTFRIFTEGIDGGDVAPHNSPEPEPDEEEIIAYTDGSAMNNGRDEATAGSGVYFGDGDIRNIATRVPAKLNPSNQVAEILAIKQACEACPKDIPLTIISDSKYSIDGLTKNLSRWEDEGFSTISNGGAIQATVGKLRERKAQTTLKWVKGHAGNAGNEGADALAAEGCNKTNEDKMDLKIAPEFTLPGVKLMVMTQSLAYKIIRKGKMSKKAYQEALNRKATMRNMEYAKGAASDANGTVPSTATIWGSTKHKDLTRKIKFFLWMLIHDGYKVGNHWKKIEALKERAICRGCEVTESMEHILTHCDATGQSEVWDLASEVWKKKTGDDLKPTIGEIMACGAITRGDRATTRLFRILVSESAYLIWCLRNERVIREKGGASDREIKNRWLKTINKRIALDCLLSNKAKYGNKSINKSLVLKTWQKTLLNEDRLLEDWTKETGVLVGVG